MGRISDIIPTLYYNGKNQLGDFLKALDPEIDAIEKKIKAIPELIDVDRCPDDKLPYLAAMINCPLVGEAPSFWRKQIRNWPYLLKLKGTEKSLILALESIGAESYSIQTYFRDAGGSYTTNRPDGEPYLNPTDGLWRNIRTHYFGIEMTVGEKFVEEQDYHWTIDDLQKKLRIWLERSKPFHAELLNLLIIPKKLIPDDHICLWDVCTWEHGEPREYGFGDLAADEGGWEPDAAGLGFAITIWRKGSGAYDDAPRWDVTPWETDLYVGAWQGIAGGMGRAFSFALDWESAAEGPDPEWDEDRTWECDWSWGETDEVSGSSTGFLFTEGD